MAWGRVSAQLKDLGWTVAQLVELLPSIPEALGLIPA